MKYCRCKKDQHHERIKGCRQGTGNLFKRHAEVFTEKGNKPYCKWDEYYGTDPGIFPMFNTVRHSNDEK